MAMIIRSALFWDRRFPGGPPDGFGFRNRGSLDVSHFSSVLYDWTPALNDTYQHDDKRQHKKKMDEAA